MKKIIIGARGSKLSSAYVSKVKNLLLQSHRDIDFEVKVIKTSGDIHQNIKISEIMMSKSLKTIKNNKKTASKSSNKPSR